ncbi:hypothetical protein CYMTET_24639 [Cymbomonas tetramitiformis]|uniref:Uncharacterized protein n=1 Tax=Cymbomonas tetramitiformis TaxID=36881 RepID=A0AAE0L025_9CHLO|nr:hypothetical protein CYMTET_24639 [Cymbomonas tetramitiformis]
MVQLHITFERVVIYNECAFLSVAERGVVPAGRPVLPRCESTSPVNTNTSQEQRNTEHTPTLPSEYLEERIIGEKAVKYSFPPKPHGPIKKWKPSSSVWRPAGSA